MYSNETFSVYLDNKIRRVKGIRVRHWAMRPYQNEPSHETESYIFWHIQSGIECRNGPGPKDVILAFLNSKVAVRLGDAIQAAQANGARSLAEATFYGKVMPAWIKFAGDRCAKEYEELEAKQSSLRPGFNKLHNILQDKTMSLSTLHARNLARSIADDHAEVIEALNVYADSEDAINKAKIDFNTRWYRGR